MTMFKAYLKNLFLSLSVIGIAMLAVSAYAGAASPWWNLNTSVRPATIPSGGQGTIVLRAFNLGDGATTAPATLTALMPAGVSVQGVAFYAFPEQGNGSLANIPGACQTTASSVSCSTARLEEEKIIPPGLQPYEYIEIRVKVRDEGAASGAEYEAKISGGAAPLKRRSPLPIGEGPPAFGAESYTLVPEEEGPGIDARAGSHPYQLTTAFDLNQDAEEIGAVGATSIEAPALVRNLHFELPPGQIGNPNAIPQCDAVDFSATSLNNRNQCPVDTVIGVAEITISEPHNLGIITLPVPLFNLTPAFGEPARFGFELTNVPVILDTAVRSGPGEDYGVTVNVSNITQLAGFVSSTLTFWGVPGDASHDQSRGWTCLASGHWALEGESCKPEQQEKPAAFLTLPTDCAAPYATSVDGESWTDPATHPIASTFSPFSYSLENAAGSPVGLVGCNQLPFRPTISAEATTNSASSPSGLDFNLNFDDEGLTSAEGRAQSQLKNTVVTLPEGFTINPSAGVGLGGCSEADYARETIDSAPGAGCPNDSKLGTVEIQTPLLTQKIQGAIFIAQPYENPSGSLVALYVVAKSPETGVLIKLAGKVTPDPVTGQLVTTFENNPELPFDHFNFHFREGQQAPLVSPATCGAYAVQAALTPWSDPTATLTETSSFTITKGAEGSPCPSGGAPPFHPGIQAGMQNNNAGTFSPFYLRLTRTDGEQEISGFSTNLPPGLTGDLSGIPFCPDADIALARTKTGAQEEANPSCPASSQIGHTLVGTGVGAVLAYVPGKIYLAGPFHGAPFSIVAVTSAVVGPFDLGTVVLRFGLSIDPYTAQVSVTPTSSEPIPTIIKGIVTHVRDIRVYIDRPSFTLNPTSCNPMVIGSTLSSSLGAGTTVTSPFQDASCANLKFAPKFSASTSGKASRANGASLSVKLSYPPGPAGTYANIARVKVELPKKLPSRLTTLQKACTAAQFDANPAGCPAASIIGHAKAITPLIPVPLEGPAYFVSHGGEAFPSLIIVLQGYGVTIDLVGSTFISKTGITSSTFKTVPDQPIGSFELTLPEGQFSALAANGNLCASKLAMPTEFVAQNGAKINKSTAISVTGCAKKKSPTRAQKLKARLKACHKNKGPKRARCEKAARK